MDYLSIFIIVIVFQFFIGLCFLAYHKVLSVEKPKRELMNPCNIMYKEIREHSLIIKTITDNFQELVSGFMQERDEVVVLFFDDLCELQDVYQSRNLIGLVVQVDRLKEAEIYASEFGLKMGRLPSVNLY